MKRIETDRLVAYVDRPWKLSLAFFAAGSIGIAVGVAFGAPKNCSEDLAGFTFTYGWVGLLAGIVLQYRSRVFLIDTERGSLLILERRFLRSTLRQEFALAGLEVRTSVANSARFFGRSVRYYWIWIEPPTRGYILFQQLCDQRRMQDLVSDLRSDLHRAATIPPSLG